jgi:O-antigen/teichoic acid export membrane protein
VVALGAGIVVQRTCQLAAFVLAGHALGVAGLGVLAQGLAMAAVLAVATNAGVGNLAARAIAADPDAARGLVVAVVRRRLLLGGLLASAVGLAGWLGTSKPLFWWLCALQVLPAAFDCKQLADATGRTRREVGLDAAVAALQLLAVVACTQLGQPGLETFAAIALAARCAYAGAAARAILRLRDGTTATPANVWHARPAAAQLLHEAMALGDVWLVAAVLGDAAAGFYALALRFAAAALLPSVQLVRLLLPHLLRAAGSGDAARTFATALRGTAFATLPVLAGGLVTANALCRLAGEAFAPAAPALVLLLLAGCLQHVGWQCSHALLAARADRTFAHLLGWPALAQATMLVALPALAPASGATGAVAAALVAVAGNGAFATVGLALLRPLWAGQQRRLWGQPLLLATITCATAAVPLAFDDHPLRLAAQLLAGALGYALGLWALELRSTWRRFGDGLTAASGFRS